MNSLAIQMSQQHEPSGPKRQPIVLYDSHSGVVKETAKFILPPTTGAIMPNIMTSDEEASDFNAAAAAATLKTFKVFRRK